MTARLDYRWHLRKVMADRGMFATTDLIGPLASSRSQKPARRPRGRRKRPALRPASVTCVPGGPAFTARNGRDQPRAV